MSPARHPGLSAPSGFSGFGRTEGKRFDLHPAERLLVGLILLQLVFLAWAMGGMRPWTQAVNAGLALATFIVAAWPRNYTEFNSPAGPHRWTIWPRLLRFPLFWLGACLMLYIAIQGFNPAWAYQTDGKIWWMHQINHILWLPHGTQAPILYGNPWRSLLVDGAVWLTACALWAGITRRRSLHILLVGLAVNALLLSAVAFAQRLTKTNEILWFIKSPNQIWGTFFYRNHGGAWFNLMVPVAFSLALWHYLRALRTFAKSSPAILYGFLGVILIVGVVVSHSRGAVIAQGLFLLMFLVYFTIRQFTLPPYPRKFLPLLPLLLGFAAFVIVGFRGLGAKETWARIGRLFDSDMTLEARELATRATFDMWGAAPWLGHGAGSFYVIFPLYQQHYPKIWFMPGDRSNRITSRHLIWDEAHNDIAQTLAELGVIGCLPILFGLIWGIAHFIRRRAWASPVAMPIALMLVCTVGHSWGEFVFQCPAILAAWVILAVLSLRWCEFDSRPQSN